MGRNPRGLWMVWREEDTGWKTKGVAVFVPHLQLRHLAVWTWSLGNPRSVIYPPLSQAAFSPIWPPF